MSIYISSFFPKFLQRPRPEESQNNSSRWSQITHTTHTIFHGLVEQLHSFGTRIKHKMFKQPCNMVDTIDEAARARIFSHLSPQDLHNVAQANRQLSEESLFALLARFGVTPPHGDSHSLTLHRTQLYWRVAVILQIFEESSVLTEKEKAFFNHSADEIILNQRLLFRLFKAAYDLSLVGPSWKKRASIPGLSRAKTLSLKADIIRARLQEDKKLKLVLGKISMNNLYPTPGQQTHERSMTCIPKEFLTIPKLKSLNVANEAIMDIPKEIGECKHLFKLCIRNNYIASLPKKLFNLKNLRHLDLGKNKINTLSDRVAGLTKLDTLLLDGNRFENLPESVCSHPRFKYVSLQGNPLISLPTGIESLDRVGLDDSQLELIPDAVRESVTEGLQAPTTDPNAKVYMIKRPVTQDEQDSSGSEDTDLQLPLPLFL